MEEDSGGACNHRDGDAQPEPPGRPASIGRLFPSRYSKKEKGKKRG